MTWIFKPSLFRIKVAGLVSLALLFAAFLFFSHRDQFQENSLASIVRGFHRPMGKTNQSNFLSFLRRKTTYKMDGAAREAAAGGGGGGVSGARMGVMGQGDSMTTKKHLREETGVERRLSAEPYPYILNEPFKCRDSTPFLILLITAAPRQRDARNAIRQTWGNESTTTGPRFVRLFLLGTGKSSDTFLQSNIMEESRVYRDIIQQDYQDTYYNLTIKVLMGMNWVATFCPHVSYVMKTDSDMFVNVETLIQKLLKPELPPKQKYFTGYLMEGASPIRNKASKWYMPKELYRSERYPPFCSGTGYVFSGDLAGLIYQTSLNISRLHLEDVYVAVCLARLQIKPVHPPNRYFFNNGRVSYSICKYSQLVTSHYFPPNALIKLWNDLQSNKDKACVSKP